MTTNLTATKVTTSLRWTDAQGRTRGFASARGFGVVASDGRWLTFNGEAPSVWGTKRTASEIAQTIDAAALRWVEVFAA